MSRLLPMGSKLFLMYQKWSSFEWCWPSWCHQLHSLHQCYPSNTDTWITVQHHQWTRSHGTSSSQFPYPISDLTHHLWCTAMEHGQWISCFQKPEHFMHHVMCIINIPGGASIQKWPSPYFGANSNASVLTFSRHFDDAREFIEFELVHPCSEKPGNKWIKKVNCVKLHFQFSNWFGQKC